MSTPFTQSLAQDETVIGETEDELEAMVGLEEHYEGRHASSRAVEHDVGIGRLLVRNTLDFA
jgi:hypothetical protein